MRPFAKQRHRRQQRQRDDDEGDRHVDVQPAALDDAAQRKGAAQQAAQRLVEAAVRPPADGVEQAGNRAARRELGEIDGNAERDGQHRKRQRQAEMRDRRDVDLDRRSGHGAGHRARTGRWCVRPANSAAQEAERRPAPAGRATAAAALHAPASAIAARRRGTGFSADGRRRSSTSAHCRQARRA